MINITFDFENSTIYYFSTFDEDRVFDIYIYDSVNKLSIHQRDQLTMVPNVTYDSRTFFKFKNTNGITVEFVGQPDSFTFHSEKTGVDNNLYIDGEPVVFTSVDRCQYEVYEEVITKNEYSKLKINKDSIVIDAGANVGMFSLLALSRGAKKVYSIEPVFKTFRALEKNLEKYSDRVEVFCFGLGGSTRSETLYTNGWSTINSLFQLNENQSKEIQVNYKDINAFMGLVEQDIDIMKIDVEGSEYEIFYRITDENILRVKSLVMEYHILEEKHWDDIQSIIDRFLRLGYFYNGKIDKSDPGGIVYFIRA